MHSNDRAPRCFRSGLFCLIGALALASSAVHPLRAQTREDQPYFTRRNTLGVLFVYSPNSSHILLGDAENRKLLDIGVVYNRRLVLNHVVNWQYSGEFLPVALESDPTATEIVQYTEPAVETYTYNLGAALVTCAKTTATYTGIEPPNGAPLSYTVTAYCSGRRWTIGESISPIGMEWNFLPRRKTQPFVDGHGGYMYSTNPIPITDAGSFNFTFDIGAGVEIFRSKAQSVRAEYRYHHISNHSTAHENPGIDNGMFQVTYCFRLGR